MTVPLLPGALWNLIEQLLPVPPPRPNGGRPRAPDRAYLTRHPFRAAQRDSVADVSEGAGLRIGDDLLATPARLAAGGRLGSNARLTATLIGRVPSLTVAWCGRC